MSLAGMEKLRGSKLTNSAEYFRTNYSFQGFPVVVVDAMGGSEALLLCALSTLTRQMAQESHVDVYEACRMSHLARPGAWRAQENYFFLYQVGLCTFFNIFASVRRCSNIHSRLNC